MNQFLTKMKTKFRAAYLYTPDPGESKFGISMTIPGQSYSVQEALNRIQKGLPVPGRNYTYQEDGETDPPMRMNDLTDIDIAKDHLKSIRDAQKKAVDEIKRKADQAKKDAPGNDGSGA